MKTRKTKADRLREQAEAEAKAKAEAEAEEQALQAEAPRDQPLILICMKCGKEIWPESKRYTVRDDGRWVSVLCPACAYHKANRISVPYLSYHAKRALGIKREALK